jgi:hypothetical protein
MARQDKLETYGKRRKAKKAKVWIILLIFAGMFIAYLLYQNYSNKIEILELNIQLAKTSYINSSIQEKCSSSALDYFSGFFKGFLNNEKYSLFVKFLIFLGAIYLLMIGISIFADLTELIAFAFISLRGIIRLPKKIINKFHKLK